MKDKKNNQKQKYFTEFPLKKYERPACTKFLLLGNLGEISSINMSYENFRGNFKYKYVV